MSLKLIVVLVVLAFFVGVIALVYFANRADKKRPHGPAAQRFNDNDGPG